MVDIPRHGLISHRRCVGGSAVVSQVKCVDGAIQVFHEGFSKRREVSLGPAELGISIGQASQWERKVLQKTVEDEDSAFRSVSVGWDCAAIREFYWG